MTFIYVLLSNLKWSKRSFMGTLKRTRRYGYTGISRQPYTSTYPLLSALRPIISMASTSKLAEFYAHPEDVPFIPDNLTLAQFILDAQHPMRPSILQDKPWLVDYQDGRGLGFADLRSRTYGLANSLYIRWKLAEDEVVCICAPNHLDYPVELWAAHRLGAAVVTSNPQYTALELAYQLSLTKSRLLFIHSSTLPVATVAAKNTGIPMDNIVLVDNPPNTSFTTLEQLIREGISTPQAFTEKRLAPGEGKTKVALYTSSSGTTGKPKAVAITHYNIIANVLLTAAHQKVGTSQSHFRPGDVGIAVIPFFHIYGMIVNLAFSFFCATTIVVMPKFDFPGYLQSIAKYRITYLFIVPPMVLLMVKHPLAQSADFSSIRVCITGAAPLSDELMQRFLKHVPHCRTGQGYGMTETAGIISFLPCTHRNGVPGSVGQLISGTDAKVVSPINGSIVKIGESGELWVRSASVAKGYLHNKEATAETFQDGWVRTGDEVRMDENREIFILDRIKEFIKVRGFQVAPSELEGCLLDHAAVADACVVSVLDEYTGELPLAYVVLSADAARSVEVAEDPMKAREEIKASIIQHVMSNKAPFKQLAGGVEFISEIPKTASGKILRRVLRDQARAGREVVKAKI